MRFAHSWILYLTPLVVAAVGWLLWRSRRSGQSRRILFVGGPNRSWAAANTSVRALNLDLVLSLGVLTFALLALARPLWFRKSDQSSLQGIPYLIALDASRSMLVQDVRPSRWYAATNALDRF
ncbi:MAG: hypothetical protein ACKO3H_01195, partial [Verrucomicrobiota bacterium]